jgi:hypothetical protein
LPPQASTDPPSRHESAFAEFDALFRHVPFAAGLIDRDLRYTRVNAKLAEYNGTSIGDHLGRTVREVVPH